MTNIVKVVEKVVAEYSEEKKAEVTDWILKLGIRPDDPLFNLYAELGTTQFALQQLPGRLDSLVVGWTDMVDDKLNSASKVAIQQQKSAIAEAAKDLVKMTKQAGGALPHLDVSNWRLAQVAGVLGFVLALGTAIGVFTYKTIAGSITFQPAASGSAILQPEDKKLLDWAKSNEGKVKIVVWSLMGMLCLVGLGRLPVNPTNLFDFTASFYYFAVAVVICPKTPLSFNKKLIFGFIAFMYGVWFGLI